MNDCPRFPGIGSLEQAHLTLRNTGSAAWDGDTKLVPLDVPSPFYDPSWLHESRIVALGPLDPGQEKEIAFTLRAPETPGTYTMRFKLVQEAVTWMETPAPGDIPFQITVTEHPMEQPTLTIANHSQTVFGPGSFMVLQGSHFTPGVPVQIAINGHTIGQVAPAGDGSFAVLIFFAQSTPPGVYLITASQADAQTTLSTANAQLEVTIATDGAMLPAPADPPVTFQALPTVYLPMIVCN